MRIFSKKGVIILWIFDLIGIVGIWLSTNQTIGILNLFGIDKTPTVKVIFIILLLIVGIVTSVFIYKDKDNE
jgi:predicted RND superfamily exporter protein